MILLQLWYNSNNFFVKLTIVSVFLYVDLTYQWLIFKKKNLLETTWSCTRIKYKS